MNTRDRFIRMLEGKEVDRVPFTPRMDIWYGFHKNHCVEDGVSTT